MEDQTLDDIKTTVTNVAGQAKDTVNKIVNPNLTQQWGNTLANTGKAVGDYAQRGMNYVSNTYNSPGFQQGLQNVKNTASEYGNNIYNGLKAGDPKYLAGAAAAGLGGAAYLMKRRREGMA